MKAAIGQIREEYAFSERRACRLLLLAVGSYRYVSRRNDEPLRTRLVELARAKPRFGYRRLHVLLEREGEAVNHKRLHRVYREAGLSSGVRAGDPSAERGRCLCAGMSGARSGYEFCQPESDACADLAAKSR